MTSQEDVSPSVPDLYSLLDEHASYDDFQDDINAPIITFSVVPRFGAQFHSHISNDGPSRAPFGESRTAEVGQVIADYAFADGEELLRDLSLYYSDVGNVVTANITGSTTVFGALPAAIVTLEEPANQNLPVAEGA